MVARLAPGSDRANAFGIGLFLFAVYLFNFNGLNTSWDGEFAFAATQNLVQHHEFSASQMWWNGVRQEVPTLNAEPQSKYGLGTVLVGVPLYSLALLIPGVSLVHVTLLSTALATALTGVVLYLLLRALNYAPAIAGLSTLAYGMATTAAVYARDYFSEPFVALSLLAATLTLLAYRRRPATTLALAAGLCLASAVLLKLTNILIVPIFLLYGFGVRPWKVSPKDLFSVGAPLALAVAMIAYYNWERFGSPLVTGYPPSEDFSGNILDGVLGMLLLPQKGLIFYTPLVLAVLPGLAIWWRSWRREALLCAGVLAFHVLVFSAWHDWQGGVNWGPRFLVPALPFLMLPLAAGLAQSRMARLLFWILLPLSLAMQVLGSGVSYLAPQSVFARGTLPRQMPPLAHLALFDLRHLDSLWVRHLASGDVIDFVSAGLPLFLIALALVVLWRPRRWLFALAGLASIVVCWTMLARSVDDPRVAVSPEMLAMVQTLSQRSQPGDVIVVGNDQLLSLFFNYYRGPAKWYALLPEKGALPQDEGWLFERLAREHTGIWLVTDTPAAAPIQRRPFEAWYAAHVYERASEPVGTQARLIQYVARPALDDATPMHASALHFGSDIDLLGYDLSTAGGPSAQTLTVALYWQARVVPADNYTVFVQVLDAAGRLVWQSDRYPANNFRPTLGWQPNERVSDPYLWDIPRDVAPGTYTVIAGLYLTGSGKRLPITSADGRPQGDYLSLGSFEVQ